MLPEIVLDSDTFDSLAEEYKNKIAGLYPDWTDYNYHDPGITFLELFAWLRENQQFFMEQLGEAHYRHFFRLMGIKPRGRVPARVWARASRTNAGEELTIPAGTMFESGGLPFETICDERIPEGRICMVRSCGADGSVQSELTDVRLSGMNAVYISPFGDGLKTGAALYIYTDKPLKTGRDYHLSLQFETDGVRNEAPGEDFIDLIGITWQYRTAAGWQAVSVKQDETRNMLYSGRITFSLDEGEPVGEDLTDETGAAGLGRGYAIRAVLDAGQYAVPPVCEKISLYDIVLEQRRSMRWEDGETIGTGNGFPDQVYSLPSAHPLAESIVIKADDVMRPGQVWDWERTDDPEGASPDDSVYMVNETDGTVSFGNGYCGFPPEGRIAVYEMAESAGADGNVKDNAAFLCRIFEISSGFKFRMSRLVRRGMDPETVSEAMLRAIREQGRTVRAVTLEDYETLTRQVPGLTIHSCHAWYDEMKPRTVNLVVRPGNAQRCSQLSQRYRENILAFLEPRKLLGTKIVLYAPQYIVINVAIEVIPSAQYRDSRSIIERTVRQWFKAGETVYGQPLEYSTLYGEIDSLACVRKIGNLSLETPSTGIRRSSNNNLLPPVNGVFILGTLNVTLNDFRMSR